jgi:hypothetical protein
MAGEDVGRSGPGEAAAVTTQRPTAIAPRVIDLLKRIVGLLDFDPSSENL